MEHIERWFLELENESSIELLSRHGVNTDIHFQTQIVIFAPVFINLTLSLRVYTFLVVFVSAGCVHALLGLVCN